MLEIGRTLREAREKRGLSLSQCETLTRIRGRYLAALEDERFDVIPPGVYAKSFLRSYATLLDAEPDLLIDQYVHRFEAEPEMAQHAVRPIPRRRVRARMPGGQLAWLALGGVTSVALLVWIGAGDGGQTAVPLPPVLPPPAPAPAAAPPAATTPPPVAARPAAAVVLSLTGVAPGGSYVEVRRSSFEGQTVWVGTLAPGVSRRFRDPRALWVRAGWTPGLKARLNGRPIALDGGTANFKVTRTAAERLPG